MRCAALFDHSLRRLALAVAVACTTSLCLAADAPKEARPARDEAELKFWLANMVQLHRFSNAEVAAATGLSDADITAALQRFDIRPTGAPPRQPGDPLRVVPYPGGRHPRIGFLDGAVDPQRETKISVFAPWNDTDYVVADIPEAIWSNLGLTYLAHTHVPTIWTKQGVELERQEWIRHDDGSLDFERTLPNGIRFGTKVTPKPDHVLMEMWLTNGTQETLSDLRVQSCVMLKGAKGFDQQTNDNKITRKPYVACRNDNGTRWIITAWEPCHRAWNNKPCPCMHSDPKFPDCAPGETRHLRGWLSFYEGTDIEAEFDRIAATKWDKPAE